MATTVYTAISRIRLTKAQWIGLIFISGIVIRSALACLIWHTGHVFVGEADAIARSLAQRGEFADPYSIPTGPTAHCNPFYPFLLSIVYRVLGVGIAGEIVRIVLIVLANSALCALLPLTAEAIGLPLWSGIGAGLAAALVPMHRTAEATQTWDDPYAAMGLMALLALLARWLPLKDHPIRIAAAYGALWGLLLHAASPMLLVLAGLSVSAILTQRANPGAEFRRWVVVWVLVGLVLTPWTLRNRVRLGGWTFVRSNLGIELELANNDRSSVSVSDNWATGMYRSTHPASNRAEAERIRAIGEIAYNRERFGQAVSWVATHPRRFALLTVGRFATFWLGWWGTPVTSWVFTLCTALAAIGAWRLWRDKRSRGLHLLGIVWLCFPLPYYLIQNTPRYRVAIWWTVVLAASYGAGYVLDNSAFRRLVQHSRALPARQDDGRAGFRQRA